MTKRLDFIDISKGIGIILVVIGHVMNISNYESIFISSFHMPMFFLISGYLFNSNKYDDFFTLVKHKFISLIIPYIIYGFIGVLFQISALLLQKRSIDLLSIFYGLITGKNITNGPLWFLLCLFLIEVIYYIIDSKVRNNFIKLVIIFLLVYVGFSLPNNFTYLFRINVALSQLLFFYVGNLIKNKNIEIKYNGIYAFLSLVATIFIAYKLNILVIVSRAIYGNTFYFILSALFGSIFIINLSVLINGNYKIKNVMIYFGKRSLIIMCTHFIVLLILSTIQKIVFKNIFNPLINLILLYCQY